MNYDIIDMFLREDKASVPCNLVMLLSIRRISNLVIHLGTCLHKKLDPFY